MHTHENDTDNDSDIDDDNDDDGDDLVLQQQVEEVKDLQQEQLSPSDNDGPINDSHLTEELRIPKHDGSTEDESARSDSDSDDEMELSQQNRLHRPHRDPILDDQPSSIEKKATVVDPATVRKHVKRTLMKKQKSQRRQPPPPQGGNQKIRKQHSKKKQIPEYFEAF